MTEQSMVWLLNTYGVFVLILVAMGYLWVVEREHREALRVLFSVMMAGIVAIVLKELFTISRPFLVEGKVPMAGMSSTPSFPSFHSALAFSAATTVTYTKKGLGLLLILMAILVGVGRVVADVHYPADIVVGVIIGVVIASLIQSVRAQR